MTHKSEDYKISAVKYYLNSKDNIRKTCKIFDCKKSTLQRWIQRYKTSKNHKLLPAYREKYPCCQYADSKHGDKYNKMVLEALGGEGDEAEKEDKIIRNISKATTIKKE
jgi:uncharacterized protein YjcR